MKKVLLIIVGIFILNSTIHSQQITNGPDIENANDKIISKLLDGNDSCFFAYRLKARGDDTYFMIEKYDKASLKRIYSENLEIGNNLENILAVGNKLYVFCHGFDDVEKVMTLYFQEISSEGKILSSKGELIKIEVSNVKDVDFEIIQNPDKTKFLVKASYKTNKANNYQTDFVFFDSKTFKLLNTKIVEQKYFSQHSIYEFEYANFFKEVQFVDFSVDTENNIFYGYSFIEKIPETKQKQNKLIVVIIPPEKKSKTVLIPFDLNYTLWNVKLAKNDNNELIVAGFLKNVEARKGRDLVNSGVFGYTINLESYEITGKAINLFDDTMLTALETKESERLDYKIDYLFPVGKNVFLVGEQYDINRIVSDSKAGPMKYNHEYKDVIVAKYNPEGKFEWIKNTPLRYTISNAGPLVLKAYAAFSSDNKIYILNNESSTNLKIYSKPNFNPKFLTSHTNIKGTNLVYSSLSIEDGKIEHNLLFDNKTFCFFPTSISIPTFITSSIFTIYPNSGNKFINDNEEMFLRSDDELYIYTHQKGKDRFSKIVFEK